MGTYRIGAKAYKKAHYQKHKSTYTKQHRAYYESHHDECIANAIRSRDKIRAENRLKIMEYLQSHPCIDCGISDWMVLQFDHLPGKKKLANLSEMVKNGWPWRRILQEIEKCAVRCANCHQKISFQRTRNYRSIQSTKNP